MKKSHVVFAPAKINLCLDVIKKSSSGFHEIRTVFAEVKEFFDEITLEETDHVSTNPDRLGLPFTALELLKKKTGTTKNALITIKKNIPYSSGLGGVSSDAAAVLKGLNELWSLELSQKDLLMLAAKLGQDVPFFILGGIALGEHYGEIITPLKNIPDLKFEILSQKLWPDLPAGIDLKNKTGEIYERLDLKKCNKNSQKTTALLQGIECGDKKSILENLHNDFEILYGKLPQRGHLSGSGPAIFQDK